MFPYMLRELQEEDSMNLRSGLKNLLEKGKLAEVKQEVECLMVAEISV